MRRWLRWSVRLVLPVLLGAVAAAPAAPVSALDEGAVVRTTGGLVMGTVNQSSRAFLGIPFAAPPVGDLRWRPPQPAAPWRGVRDATQFGPACAQVPGVFAANAGQGSTSEDCLYLNVYTPHPARPLLPVMVWIHGGGFTAGSASQYDPTVLSVKGRAVVVTINYRLGPSGFLALPGLSAEQPDHSSGNYGLQDQQAALRWVRANVAAFGGNPFDVSIFGESAGGLSVCANLASPTAAGTFERAITESGPCVAPLPTVAAGEASGSTTAGNLGCPTSGTVDAAGQVACMRALPVSTLLGATGQFGPKVGGSVLPEQLTAAISSGRFNHVPVIEGTNHDEYRLFVAILFDIPGHPITSPAQYAALIAGAFGSAAAPAVLAEYPFASFPNGSIAFSTVVTDARFACPARAADALLSAQVPTFGYEFNDPNAPVFIPGTSDPVMPLRAYHASELPYVFQPATTTGFFTAAQLTLSDQMIGYWSRFTAFGSPNGFGAPAWTRYTIAGDQLLSLAPGATAVTTGFAADHHCAFWASLAA
jgi:para-nitrobenzyl esterase